MSFLINLIRGWWIFWFRIVGRFNISHFGFESIDNFLEQFKIFVLSKFLLLSLFIDIFSVRDFNVGTPI